MTQYMPEMHLISDARGPVLGLILTAWFVCTWIRVICGEEKTRETESDIGNGRHHHGKRYLAAGAASL